MPGISREVQWMSWTNGRLEPLLHMLVMELVRLPEGERDPAKVDTPELPRSMHSAPLRRASPDQSRHRPRRNESAAPPFHEGLLRTT